MYIENGQAPGAADTAGGWRVEPAEVRTFAAKVDAVQALLERVRSAARQLETDRPQLGTSPVGHGLSDKFADRAGTTGLAGQVEQLTVQVEDFVAGAEATAARYQATDTTNATSFNAQL